MVRDPVAEEFERHQGLLGCQVVIIKGKVVRRAACLREAAALARVVMVAVVVVVVGAVFNGRRYASTEHQET